MWSQNSNKTNWPPKCNKASREVIISTEEMTVTSCWCKVTRLEKILCSWKLFQFNFSKDLSFVFKNKWFVVSYLQIRNIINLRFWHHLVKFITLLKNLFLDIWGYFQSEFHFMRHLLLIWEPENTYALSAGSLPVWQTDRKGKDYARINVLPHWTLSDTWP